MDKTDKKAIAARKKKLRDRQKLQKDIAEHFRKLQKNSEEEQKPLPITKPEET